MCPKCRAVWAFRPRVCASCEHREAVAVEVGSLPEEAYLTWSAVHATSTEAVFAVEDGAVAFLETDDGFAVVDTEKEA